MYKCIGKYCDSPKKDPSENKWRDCEELAEGNYKYCKNCVGLIVKVCTCNKVFITGIPETVSIKDDFYTIPSPIPDYFFKQIKGNIYGIQGCRGCKYKDDEVLEDVDKAIRKSISSCVYQKIGEEYEYMSDALDPIVEEKLLEMGINLGQPANIEVSF